MEKKSVAYSILFKNLYSIVWDASQLECVHLDSRSFVSTLISKSSNNESLVDALKPVIGWLVVIKAMLNMWARPWTLFPGSILTLLYFRKHADQSRDFAEMIW